MNEATRKRVEQILTEKLVHPVTILLFTGSGGEAEEYTEISRELCQILTELGGGKLSFREVSAATEAETAAAYRIERTPAFALLDADGHDQHFRIYGAPMGYEFSVLLDDLIDVSRQETRLSETTKAELAGIDQEVLIQVFSTPT
jgi:alkyl hydroperoxide reductase subunit AhpF